MQEPHLQRYAVLDHPIRDINDRLLLALNEYHQKVQSQTTPERKVIEKLNKRAQGNVNKRGGRGGRNCGQAVKHIADAGTKSVPHDLVSFCVICLGIAVTPAAGREISSACPYGYLEHCSYLTE